MAGTKISAADARITETPNASMTTLASPTQGGTTALSLWRTTMGPGQRGPIHRFDVEQAWHLLEGKARIAVDGEAIDLAVGDTVVVPAASTRQVETTTGAVFVVCSPAGAVATPLGDDGPGAPVSPAWIE